MASEKELPNGVDQDEPGPTSSRPCFLQKFKLYETRSNFYMIGRNKRRGVCKVLKIDRLDPSELNILEDSATYTDDECYDLLKRIHEGNKSMGGLKFITVCYGIIGFVKFLGPYYMLIITKRRKIGAICGHTIYGISSSKMLPVPNSSVRSKLAYSGNEKRYKSLLCTVNLTKDFFFSYSYNVMRSLQKNLCDSKTGPLLYENMFVWNDYLTQEIQNRLKNTLWTVALVYGFFRQVNLSVSGRDCKLTIIARRSRHFAGTRKMDDDESLSLNCSSEIEDEGSLETEISNTNGDDVMNENHSVKPSMFQKGVLQTNCIDCLDRTNVAQYAYGLVALGQQLHALGFLESKDADSDNPLAEDLMRIYEAMGDVLALQYGGSAAHNKIFSEQRGQWKAATQSQESIRALQRYFSNAYVDAQKQDAINVFLWHYQPLQGKPALWDRDSNRHYHVGRRNPSFSDDNGSSFLKRSLSDGNIVCESDSPRDKTDVGNNQPLFEISEESSKNIFESAPLTSTCETAISCRRLTPSVPSKQLFRGLQDQCLNSDHIYYDEHDDDCNFSNFIEADWLSTSGNSGELSVRSIASRSSETLVNTPKSVTSKQAHLLLNPNHQIRREGRVNMMAMICHRNILTAS